MSPEPPDPYHSPMPAQFKKHLGEAYLYTFDFSQVLAGLAPGLTLSGTPLILFVTGSPTDLVFGAPAISGQGVQVLISGGSQGVQYQMKCRCNLSAGQQIAECLGDLLVSDT